MGELAEKFKERQRDINEIFENKIMPFSEVNAWRVIELLDQIMHMLGDIAYFLDRNMEKMGLPKVGRHPDKKTENSL